MKYITWSFRVFMCCNILFLKLVVPLQFNLHLTQWDNHIENDTIIQHDCLRIDAWEDLENVYEIVSYCMGEWPSKWNIENNNFTQKFTFVKLLELNITSEQLYSWSAPMDIIEDYQHYLNKLSISNETLLSTYIYYNCTLPNFGSMCQYSFDEYEPSYSSFHQIILSFYQTLPIETKSAPCYTYLKCDLGFSSLCISWVNICDGVVQCIDGIDEAHCWQLEINECKEDEYRCHNGQCIPLSFVDDNVNTPDCLDGSDEGRSLFFDTKWKMNAARFKFEEITCFRFHGPTFVTIRGHNRKCFDARFLHPENSIYFPEKPETISNQCWLALNCYLTFTIDLDLNCDDICQNDTCKQTINDTCPDMFYMPNAPIAFGHIYFAYTKRYIIEQNKLTNDPEYICYNDQLCGGFLPNTTIILFNNTVCRRPQDFPIYLPPTDKYLLTYIETVYGGLYKCNTILRNYSIFCNESTMYQCKNSSKCIAQIRLYDGKQDCDYNDDEIWISNNQTCPIKNSQMYIICTNNNQCISRKSINDGPCNCDTYHSYYRCDDEPTELDYVGSHISFPIICDNYNHLQDILFTKYNETDETECEHWPCNNIYTHCNGIWDCPNGEDELDCYPLWLINCSRHSYVCFSPKTSNYMCLSGDKINDGNIDCLGALDESQFCRSEGVYSFYCKTKVGADCMHSRNLCNEEWNCLEGEDEQFCDHLEPHFFQKSDMCAIKQKTKGSDIQKFLCNLLTTTEVFRMGYFSLGEMRTLDKHITKSDTNTDLVSSLVTKNFLLRPDLCHRSLILRIWLDKAKDRSIASCICPSNYYGDRCQFQGERVSLTIQFQTFSSYWQTPFIIVVLLIDDSDERIIHSSEQFTYLSTLNCKTKYNIDLLYSTRPKNQSKQYSVHIDVYNKSSLLYQGSLLLLFPFPFLPVQRIATELYIPHSEYNYKNCTFHQCVHGQCVRYFNDSQYSTFCQCNKGWSGRYCNISQYNCTCSSDSLCIGILANNRSICVCPIHKWGSRCLLDEQVCQSNNTCHNGGQCITTDKDIKSENKFVCICQEGFFGKRCEISQNIIILSFEKNMILPPSMLIHFIEVIGNAHPKNGTAFKIIPIDRKPVTIYWSRSFHIVFVEFIPQNYYLLIVQNHYKQSTTDETTLKSSNRCPHIKEVFNETFADFRLIHRIKYYHLPCQQHSPQRSCFYDEVHICLCQDLDDRRVANCFEFNHEFKRDCRVHDSCKNGGTCLQDNANCPKTSTCICRSCFYGLLCQFNSNGFGLSLDAILGSYIQPYVNIIYQPVIVQISITLTILMTIMGLINGICSLMTFMNKEPRKFGCGYYLLGSSITTLVITIIFSIKFWILLATQMTYKNNRSFLYFQCRSIDFILRIGLYMDQWLNACVAFERAVITTKGINFNKTKSRRIAKIIMAILFLLTIGTSVHEMIYRDLLDDNSNDGKRIWCVVSYSTNIQSYNLAINIFHFCTPFAINLLSAIIIIIKTTRLRTNAKTQQNYKKILFEQLRQHKHLLITPLLLIILAIPRLIISFVAGCMESPTGAWLFLIGYFISFIPPILTFFIFVIPSKTYKEEFYSTYRRFQRSLQTYFCLFR